MLLSVLLLTILLLLFCLWLGLLYLVFFEQYRRQHSERRLQLAGGNQSHGKRPGC